MVSLHKYMIVNQWFCAEKFKGLSCEDYGLFDYVLSGAESNRFDKRLNTGMHGLRKGWPETLVIAFNVFVN